MVRLALGVLLAILFAVAKPVSAAPPVEAYGKLPAITEVHLSPSGERYAFIATVGETRKLYIATIDNKPLDVTDIGDTKVREVSWAGDDHVLVASSATVNLGLDFNVGKDELDTVFVLTISTGKLFQVFGHAHQREVANTVRGSFGTAQIDGHWYGWFGGITYNQTASSSYFEHGYPDLYRVDLDTGQLFLAAHGQEDSDAWLIGTTGEVVARSLYNEKAGTWRVLKGRDGSQEIASGHGEFGGVGAISFGRTADTVLIYVPDGAGGDGYSFRELSIDGGPARAMPGDDGMIDPLIDPISKLWIGEGLEDDELQSAFFSPALQARWRGARKAFPNNISHLKSWSADFNRMIVFTEGGDDPGTYWMVDIAKHSAVPIGSEYPLVKDEDVGPVRMVDWKAADGLPLRGVLTLPPGREAKSLPLVVFPHGGPEARDYPAFDWWAQAYASRGYAVFQPNFRGSSGYGVAFRDAGLGQWGRKMQTDISDGVAELTRQGIVDPKRACIVGASYGGYAALAGVTVQQGLYRCAVSVAGVANLTDMLNYDRKRAGGSSSSMRFWKAFMGVTSHWGTSELDPITPSELAGRADAPILLIHGKDDTVVPIEQSETMASALRSAGKPVEFVKMDNEDHRLSREATRVQMLQSAVAFVEKHNPAN